MHTHILAFLVLAFVCVILHFDRELLTVAGSKLNVQRFSGLLTAWKNATMISACTSLYSLKLDNPGLEIVHDI